MSDPIGKPHAKQTREHWLAAQGKSALRTAYNAIPIRDTARAEWFSTCLLDAVRGDMSIEAAEAELAKRWQ